MESAEARARGTSPETLSSLFETPHPALRLRLDEGRPPWWRAFGPRRLVVAGLAAPVLLHEYAAQVGGWSSLSWPWLLALTAVSLIASLTVATYVPQRGMTRGSSPCASLAGFTVVFAGLALGGAPLQVGTVLLAGGLAAYGLRQRLRGAEACAPRGRAGAL